ncbi:hypothetical protein [Streptomyces cinereospinus]|uniref:Transport-associated OB type 1 domain-containing protein n=1 Tax=Streptomyces cinereospinus TaxID=285561 RepID=A0ABV5N8F0_9ACTN
MLEDRVVGQDRVIDADRQLRPVGDAVVDGIVDGQEGGPVAVEVAEGTTLRSLRQADVPIEVSRDLGHVIVVPRGRADAAAWSRPG